MTPPTLAAPVAVPARVDAVDVDGDALRLVLARTPAVVVASRTWSVDHVAGFPAGTVVTAEVLAASHRVSIAASGIDVVETVACDTGGPAPVDEHALPQRHRSDIDGVTMNFESRVVAGDAGVAALAGRLRAATERADDTLLAAFPGHADALTAIEVDLDDATLGWRTWHLYPGRRPHAVLTTTTVAPTIATTRR